ncbi:cytochrome c peroxidase [Oceanihabitans sp. 2_MG-2023]|uniref:cytochrome-c peroxidase n=1 Tax=Oceanihabitans sp. 2_MG-2023 TaxID=3062661 RepID=UPI0026E2B48F|nr:cytochrome c peroxidase [Oceanihabitans sp. 2_MG-2023]MDO6598164.1 cytochrome c peroxidase [Oceanihabitans sp. 2_MG-2023]
MKRIVLFLLVCFAFLSCSEDSETEAYVAIPLEVVLPENFPDIAYNLDNNPVTEAGFELGKDLFYEGKLSSNGAIACAFCHEQAFAFTHHGHNLSHGVNGGVGFRNAQPIQNLAYQTSFMWNGAASHLDLQPIIPITAEVEMGETLSNVISKLSADPEYQVKFAKAFEDGEVSTENMLKALSQFMLMMVSSNATYDKYVRQEDNVTLTAIELDGLNTFQQKCTSCHATDLFTDQTFRNNGLPINPLLNDTGRYEILEDPNDLYTFKVPSLRNVEVTGPYMHDGRFTTLEVVLDFYDSGAVDNGNVDPSLLREDNTYGITLNDYEKESLIAFLKTLTDNEFLEDERFSEF